MKIEFALEKILLNQDKFRPDFYDWLNENYHIYHAFEIEADKIRGRGRTHYSHRTIWEFLRHETALREVKSEFKMNDHYTKNCALLYSILHPEAKSFFEFRDKRKVGNEVTETSPGVITWTSPDLPVGGDFISQREK